MSVTHCLRCQAERGVAIPAPGTCTHDPIPSPLYACDNCGGRIARLVEDEDGAWLPGELPFWVCVECGDEMFPVEPQP